MLFFLSGSFEINLSRWPQVQYFDNSPSMVVVRREKVMPPADMSGVITAKTSSGPISRLSASTSGRRMLCDPATST